jgi:predicted nucleotidyltransferase
MQMFEQDRTLVRLQQQVLRERDILVCFLAGSYGRGLQDAYSDLDVALVFKGDAEREAAYARRRDFVRSILPYVPAKSFDADHVRPFLHIALYGNGAKVDYRYETKEGLQPNPWDRQIRILKDDKEGWGEKFQAAAGQLSPVIPKPTTTAQTLADLDNRFWVMYMDIYRQLLRGDHEKPFPVYLELLYFTVPQLLRLLPPDDPAHQGLIDVQYTPDTKVTLRHLRAVFEGYLEARSAVVRRHKLAFLADSAFENELKKRLN